MAASTITSERRSTDTARGADGAFDATLLTPVADPVEIEISSALPNCFLGVTFYDGSNNVVTTGLGGTLGVTLQTVVSEHFQQADSPLAVNAAAYKDVHCQAPTRKVRVAPSSVTGAAKYRVRIYQFIV